MESNLNSCQCRIILTIKRMMLKAVPSNAFLTLILSVGKECFIEEGYYKDLKDAKLEMEIISSIYTNKLTYKYMKRIMTLEIKMGTGSNISRLGTLQFDIGDMANNELEEVRGKYPLEECINPGSDLYISLSFEFMELNKLRLKSEDNETFDLNTLKNFRRSLSGGISPINMRFSACSDKSRDSQEFNESFIKNNDGVKSYKVNLDKNNFGLNKKGSYFKFRVSDEINSNNSSCFLSDNPKHRVSEKDHHKFNSVSPKVNPRVKSFFQSMKKNKTPIIEEVKKEPNSKKNNQRIEELLQRVSTLELSVKELNSSIIEKSPIPKKNTQQIYHSNPYLQIPKENPKKAERTKLLSKLKEKFKRTMGK